MACCRPKMRRVTDDYVVDGGLHGDYGVLANTGAGALDVTLPDADGRRGQAFLVAKISADANAVTVEVNGGGLINGAASAVLAEQWDAIVVRADHEGNYVIEARVSTFASFLGGLIEGTLTITPDTETQGLSVVGDYTDNLVNFVNAGVGEAAIMQSGGDIALRMTKGLQLVKQSEPGDPGVDVCSLWLSNGTGAGDDGDLMLKINIGGVVKTATLADYSAL